MTPPSPLSRLLPLIAAVVFGVAAVWLMRRNGAAPPPNETTPKTASVVFAKRTIESNSRITARDIEVRDAPLTLLDIHAVPAAERETIIGTQTAVRVPAGQPVLWNLLATNPIDNAVGLVESGRRALTIALPNPRGVLDLIKPGDRVDVICTYDDPGRDSEPVSRMILQNVPVLAVRAQRTNAIVRAVTEAGDGNAASDSVTLAVDADDSVLLAFAMRNAELDLAVRARSDFVTTSVPSATFETLGKPTEPPALAAPPVPGYPTLYHQGRAIGSGFYAEPLTKPTGPDASVLSVP